MSDRDLGTIDAPMSPTRTRHRAGAGMLRGGQQRRAHRSGCIRLTARRGGVAASLPQPKTPVMRQCPMPTRSPSSSLSCSASLAIGPPHPTGGARPAPHKSAGSSQDCAKAFGGNGRFCGLAVLGWSGFTAANPNVGGKHPPITPLQRKNERSAPRFSSRRAASGTRSS
jgi:hypothetical protein